MKKYISLVLALALLICSFAGLTSCTSGTGSQPGSANSPTPNVSSTNTNDPYAHLDPVEWRFSTQSGSQTVVGQMANWIAEEVSARTNGRFTIEVYTDAMCSLQEMPWDLPQYHWGKETHIEKMRKIGEQISRELDA